MEMKTGCIIRDKKTGKFIGKTFDHIKGRLETTKSMFGAMRFHDIGDASEFLLNNLYAPKDTENYEYVEVEITIKEAQEDVQAEREHHKTSRSAS